MKILLATMGLDIGGAETHITELAKELIRRGHKVIVASNGGVYEAEITGAGARHYSVPLNRRRPIPMLKSLFRLNRIIKSEKPDVVHAHARIPGFLIGIIRKFRKFPFVTTAHWVFESGGALGFLTNWGEKTVAVSEDIKEYLKKNYGVRDEDIFVTINGIDTEKFSPQTDGSAVRREFNIPDSAPVISHVSRLDESRALAARALISSAERIAAMLPGAVLLIAGDGDCFSELSEKAKAVNARLGREAVVLAGARTDVASFVAAGDYFVGVSRAALEAMSAAKPVIVAGNEGYLGIFTPDRLSEAVETNFCCRGCPETTEERLVSDIEKLIKMPKEELERLGAYGREVIRERYSVGRMTDDNLAAYRAARTPKSIVMSGYFGFDNAGDEAILSSVYSMAKKSLPEAKITVLSHSPDKTRATYGCEAVNRFSPFKIHSALKRSDVLIFGGGSLLQDRTSSRSLFYYSYILNRAYKLGNRVVMLANGIGPVTREANRNRVRKAVERAEIVTLRDPGSVTELEAMGVKRRDLTVTADPVFLLEPAGGERAEEILSAAGVPSGPFVAASVRPWSGMEKFRAAFAETCDRITRELGLNVVFITMQPGADRSESELIASLMKEKAYILPPGLDAAELMSVIGRAELTLSMRLHSLIFAARMAVPTVGFSYDPKLDAYLELLSQPLAGSVEALDVENAVTTVKSVLEHRAEKVEALAKKRDELTALAAENEKAFRALYE